MTVEITNHIRTEFYLQEKYTSTSDFHIFLAIGSATKMLTPNKI